MKAIAHFLMGVLVLMLLPVVGLLAAVTFGFSAVTWIGETVWEAMQ